MKQCNPTINKFHTNQTLTTQVIFLSTCEYVMNNAVQNAQTTYTKLRIKLKRAWVCDMAGKLYCQNKKQWPLSMTLTGSTWDSHFCRVGNMGLLLSKKASLPFIQKATSPSHIPRFHFHIIPYQFYSEF